MRGLTKDYIFELIKPLRLQEHDLIRSRIRQSTNFFTDRGIIYFTIKKEGKRLITLAGVPVKNLLYFCNVRNNMENNENDNKNVQTT